ncbi:FHA domain-containing protein [Rathayibacter sp. YIM 133350]|uniref:FHA domain-containing protein n=1 Tax=Rathayibacter sp. YIM 133350 TaxID=3131992 RepID=UPI00307F4AD0
MERDGFIVPPPGVLAPRDAPHEDSSTVERRDIRVPASPVRAAPLTPLPAQKPPFAAPPFAPPAAPPPAPPVAAAPPTAPTPTRASEPLAWRLELADGQNVAVEGRLVLGRRPVAPEESPDAVPVAVSDPARSVSKTHALIEVRDGALVVTDLHSTNGVTVADEEIASGLGVGLVPGALIRLGEFEVRAVAGPAGESR